MNQYWINIKIPLAYTQTKNAIEFSASSEKFVKVRKSKLSSSLNGEEPINMEIEVAKSLESPKDWQIIWISDSQPEKFQAAPLDLITVWPQ